MAMSTVNVGGKQFSLNHAVIQSNPDSLLASAVVHSESFFDRDPELFPTIIEYLSVSSQCEDHISLARSMHRRLLSLSESQMRALAADCLYFRLPALAHLASASFALVVPEGAKAPSWCAPEWVAQSVDAAVAVADARLEAGDVARAYVFLAGGCHRGSIMSTVPGLCVVGLGATAVEVEVVAAASPALMCLHPPRCDAGAEPDAGVEVDGVTLAACASNSVYVSAGAAVLSHCVVSAAAFAPVAAVGRRAGVALAGCRVEAACNGGVVAIDGAAARVRGCDVVGAALNGVEARGGATAEVVASRIVRCGNACVAAVDGGAVEVERCLLLASRAGVVAVAGGVVARAVGNVAVGVCGGAVRASADSRVGDVQDNHNLDDDAAASAAYTPAAQKKA